MSWRYQKRIRVLPGVHLNLSKSGLGVSIGSRGAHVGWTSRGRRYVSLGVPGTGF
jgi:S-DNA-T family DNA segregation ATPase FtsK/SpoIIIE